MRKDAAKFDMGVLLNSIKRITQEGKSDTMVMYASNHKSRGADLKKVLSETC